MPLTKACKDCRTRQPTDNYPRDKYGRIDTRQCLQCEDEHTPVLLTVQEANIRYGVNVRLWANLHPDLGQLEPVGSYTPLGRAPVHLYSRDDVDALISANQ